MRLELEETYREDLQESRICRRAKKQEWGHVSSTQPKKKERSSKAESTLRPELERGPVGIKARRRIEDRNVSASEWTYQEHSTDSNGKSGETISKPEAYRMMLPQTKS